MGLGKRALRATAAAAGVAALTFVGQNVTTLNATTIALAYLLYVLIVASTLGFLEALVSSVLATLTFNFFFLPPFGTFTIADPQNWVALFSFLVTSLIASRLSTEARKQATDALDRQRDVERLYTFSRSILLIDSSEPFPKQLVQKLADIFGISAVVLYDRRTGTTYRAGPQDFPGSEEQLREAALKDSVLVDSVSGCVITTVRLGSEPIASLGLEGALMPDSALQGIANLVAIGLERAKAQDQAHQIEAAEQSERLRTTLLDAMAHEFKTPLTSIKAATTSLIANPDQAPTSRMELIKIADEEAERLRQIIDNSIDMARLDADRIDIQLESANIAELAGEVVLSMQAEIEGRRVDFPANEQVPPVSVDRRLVKLALKQLLDNALKYSPPRRPVSIRVHQDGDTVVLELTDHGGGIPVQEQNRVFERFYRSPAVQHRIPGSGLGLSIAHRIMQAHGGDLTVNSQPGETSFRMTLPVKPKGEQD